MPPTTDDLRARDELLGRVRRDVERNTLKARNGVRFAAGAGGPRPGRTPKDLLWSSGHAQLWRYRSDRVALRPPLLLVSSLVGRSYVLDLQPGHSVVEHLQAAGFDVFLLDWLPADQRHAGERLEDYADRYLPEAVRRTCQTAGTDALNVFGYCFGGVLALLYAAHHPEAPLRSLTAMATPVDFSRWRPWRELTAEGRLPIDAVLDDDGNVPASAIRQCFRLLRPGGDVRRYATLLEGVWSDEHASAYRAMTAWSDDHVPFPGAAARQTVDMLVRDNALMHGGIRLAGDPVSLRDVRVPLLTVLAERDHIVPEHVAAPLPDLVRSEDSGILRVDAGHIGLVVGRTAGKVTIPRVIEFLRAHSKPAA